jgi:hypothetical protein
MVAIFHLQKGIIFQIKLHGAAAATDFKWLLIPFFLRTGMNFQFCFGVNFIYSFLSSG